MKTFALWTLFLFPFLSISCSHRESRSTKGEAIAGSTDVRPFLIDSDHRTDREIDSDRLLENFSQDFTEEQLENARNSIMNCAEVHVEHSCNNIDKMDVSRHLETAITDIQSFRDMAQKVHHARKPYDRLKTLLPTIDVALKENAYRNAYFLTQKAEKILQRNKIEID